MIDAEPLRRSGGAGGLRQLPRSSAAAATRSALSSAAGTVGSASGSVRAAELKNENTLQTRRPPRART